MQRKTSKLKKKLKENNGHLSTRKSEIVDEKEKVAAHPDISHNIRSGKYSRIAMTSSTARRRNFRRLWTTIIKGRRLRTSNRWSMMPRRRFFSLRKSSLMRSFGKSRGWKVISMQRIRSLRGRKTTSLNYKPRHPKSKTQLRSAFSNLGERRGKKMTTAMTTSLWMIQIPNTKTIR